MYQTHRLIDRVGADKNCQIEFIQSPDQIEQWMRVCVSRISAPETKQDYRPLHVFFGKCARLMRRTRDQDIDPGQRFGHGWLTGSEVSLPAPTRISSAP